MFWLLPIVMGLLAGFIRSRVGRRCLMPPDLCVTWLVPVAFLPQWFIFYQPAKQALIPDNLIAISLVTSQLLLLTFAWFNRHNPGFRLMGLGLVSNLLVITLNGGLMPIAPEAVARLMPNTPPDIWQIGHRLGTSKDIILPVVATRLWWLSDRLLLPPWCPYQVAFSLGDILIATGAFHLLWSLGRAKQLAKPEADIGKMTRQLCG